MEEQLKSIMTACIIANVPLIAQAVVEALNSQPHDIKTVNRMEAAKALNVSLPTLDKLIANGTVRARKIGRRVIIPESEIENILASNEPFLYRRA